jgi:uncharacterized OB-fold protein
MAEKQQLPIAENLFTWPSDEPRLIATREKSTGRISFPAFKRIGADQEARFEDIELGTKGTLWTYTIQGFPPPSPPYDGPEAPEDFKPFALGYIELPGEVKIESRITGCDLKDVEIGMELELVIEKFKEDDDGNDLMSFAFRPA